jgi:phosphoribosylformimino-5-aminoimidazole carboxamide ribotide isomerase
MPMMVLPAVDILGGRCVQLIGGDERKLRAEYGDPVDVATEIQRKGAKYLHVIDLDSALGKGNNHDIVERIVKEVSIPVQVGGGIRDHDTVDRFLDAGADRVIVGTKAILDMDWLKRIAAGHTGKVVLAMDTRGEEVLIKGWKAGSGKNLFEYARSVDGLKLAAFLFTNVILEGRMIGTDIKIVKRLVDSVRTPVVAAGGITTMSDLAKLEDVGVSGAVVGSAIYDGKLDLVEAVRRFR